MKRSWAAPDGEEWDCEIEVESADYSVGIMGDIVYIGSAQCMDEEGKVTEFSHEQLVNRYGEAVIQKAEWDMAESLHDDWEDWSE